MSDPTAMGRYLPIYLSDHLAARANEQDQAVAVLGAPAEAL